jgi:hypothetical protein
VNASGTRHTRPSVQIFQTNSPSVHRRWDSGLIDGRSIRVSIPRDRLLRDSTLRHDVNGCFVPNGHQTWIAGVLNRIEHLFCNTSCNLGAGVCYSSRLRWVFCRVQAQNINMENRGGLQMQSPPSAHQTHNNIAGLKKLRRRRTINNMRTHVTTSCSVDSPRSIAANLRWRVIGLHDSSRRGCLIVMKTSTLNP